MSSFGCSRLRCALIACAFVACQRPASVIEEKDSPAVDDPEARSDPALIVPEVLPLLSPDPLRERLVDAFDTHAFFDTVDPFYQRGSFAYSEKHPSEGRQALEVFVPMSDDPAFLDKNTVVMRTALPEPEDWSAHAFLTLDLYTEEVPTTLPEAHLVLINSQGETFSETLILGWQLFRWENRQMTFPLWGNAGAQPPVPAHILRDVAAVELKLTRFGDGPFGAPLPGVRFHVDRMRLSGRELWDAFDGPALGWHAEGDRGTRAGIGHTHTLHRSAGSLVLTWRDEGSASYAAASTGRLDENAATTAARAPLDWSGMQRLRASVWSDAPDAPVRVRLFDGAHTALLSPLLLSKADAWEELEWALPQNDFDLAHIRSIAVEVVDLAYHPRGTLYVDDLKVVREAGLLRAFTAEAAYRQNVLTWLPGASAVGAWTEVRVAADAFPLSVNEGSFVCRALDKGALPLGCVHRDAPELAYYSAFTGDDPVPMQARVQRNLLTLDGASYEAAFSRDDGALRYVFDKRSQKSVGLSASDDALWRITFADEAHPVTLSSADFSPENAARHFSVEGQTLRYDLKDGALSVAIALSAEDDGFSLRPSITNHTGRAIRTVSLPHGLAFATEHVRRVLLPLQEGMVLFRSFFSSGRSTALSRPPMFADVLALESDDGALAIYAVQDSHYQAELIPKHDASRPSFQPMNLTLEGGSVLSRMGFEHVTFIPDGATWSGVGVHALVGGDFRAVARAYAHGNGFDDRARYPTLAAKLAPFAGVYDKLAKNPIYVVELNKMVEWLKAPLGGAWDTIEDAWLAVLPKETIVHLTHWQQGVVEDRHPDTQPIHWSRYGAEPSFDAMLQTLHADGSLVMPFTNWSVWNKRSGGELPSLGSTPAAARTLRGPQYPFIEYQGYMVKPWRDEVAAVNDAMVDLYRRTYPMDMLFVDMTGERYWRYVLLDDDATPSASAYTQATIEENLRLSKQMPLFTEGVFDRLADSITGYSQTLRQKFWNGILQHLGREYLDWAAYPFAADVVHENVAFFQHDLNAEVWPATGMAAFSYYTLMGYGYYVETVRHFGEDHYWLEVADAFAKAVHSRTFARPLSAVRALTPNHTQMETVWGEGQSAVSISAFFDPLGERMPNAKGPGLIAPNGFYAETADGQMQAGVFVQRFNGSPLPDGEHWITLVSSGDAIEVRHPLGADATLAITKPAGWPASVQLQTLLQDGRLVASGTLEAAGEVYPLPVSTWDDTYAAWVRGYRLSR